MGDLSYKSLELNREYGPWEYPWRERIERYLEATENAFPWHREKSPWGPPVAPPTILGNAALRFIDSIAPAPPGTLHAKFEAEFGNALRRDRELVGYGQFVEKYERRGRLWFVFSARWRDGSGLLVGRSTVTMAFPKEEERDEAKPPKEKPRPTGPQGKVELAPEAHPPLAETRLALRTLTQERMTAYSEDSANALRGQSIHTDPAIAKAKGYPNSVAQGMMSADYISELMANRFERGWLLGGRLSLAFVKPVFCGDMLTACAAPREELDEGAFTRRVYDVWCENQRGEAVTLGTASGVVAAG